MANKKHLEILKEGAEVWNKWRSNHPLIVPDLSNANLQHYYQPHPVNLQGANFAQANLTRVGFFGANLSKANFNGANLSFANLLEANLDGAYLERANLSRVSLTRANLNGANLSMANLNGAELVQANLDSAILIEVDLRGAVLERASLKYSDLFKANLTEANLNEADLSEAGICEAILHGVNLAGANLNGAIINGTNLNKANLSYVTLISTDLSHSSLIGANLQYASFGFTKVSDTDFRKAILTQEKDDPINFLGLCFSEGLDTAKFSDDDFLHNYLAKAFEYAHQPDIRKELDLPDFLDDAINNIAALRNLYNDQQSPEHLIEVVGIITSELINYLKKHPKALYEIKPRQFEELIAEILASYGWQVDLTPSTRDGGYDIYAISPVHRKETTSWIIECKKNAHDRKVGVDIVRALYGLRMDLQIANAMLATTSYFSRDAHAYKASRYDLKLKDYGNILEWINQYRPNPEGTLYIKNNRLILPNEE